MTVVERSNPCGPKSLCHATGGTNWVDDTNWLSVALLPPRTGV